MSLIYVTGAPGAGKSTIEKELRNRGFETHDMDDSDMGGPHNLATGERVTIPSAGLRTKDWFTQHEWRTSKPALEKLKKQAEGKAIFVCGVAPDDEAVLPLFDTVIYLDVDEDTLKHRLATRTDNDYGKNDFEQAEILERYRALNERYKNLGALGIDAAQPLEKVVDTIISAAGLN